MGAQAQASPTSPSATGEMDGGVALDGGALDLVLARAVTFPVEKAVAGLA
jgi:hypothetical protein